MKRLIAISAIMLLIFGLSFAGMWYARQTQEFYQQLIEEGQKFCESEDAAALTTLAEQMEEDWEKRQSILSLYVRHDEIEKMSIDIVILKGHAVNGSFESASVTLSQMEFAAEHIYQRELPNLNNIF